MEAYEHAPKECPAPGLCLKLSDRVLSIETRLVDRDINWGRLWTAVFTLIGLAVINTGTLIYWIGGTNERLQYFKESDQRQNEMIYRLEHPNNPQVTTHP